MHAPLLSTCPPLFALRRARFARGRRRARAHAAARAHAHARPRDLAPRQAAARRGRHRDGREVQSHPVEQVVAPPPLHGLPRKVPLPAARRPGGRDGERRGGGGGARPRLPLVHARRRLRELQAVPARQEAKAARARRRLILMPVSGPAGQPRCQRSGAPPPADASGGAGPRRARPLPRREGGASGARMTAAAKTAPTRSTGRGLRRGKLGRL
mmetsp:Transcript_14768/g.47457  ORF Transcript_14768/g.47457 Transcript_14768/m.47457 type:complete len:213 (-) Transcript_14768:146-784(-)